MKFLFVFLVLTVVSINALSLTPEQKAKAKQYQAACLEETKVDPNLVKKVRKGEFTEDPALKKFALCFLMKANLVSAEGKLNEDVVMAKLPKDANKLGATVIMELCKNVEAKDPADRAYQIYKCYYEATPNHVSLI